MNGDIEPPKFWEENVCKCEIGSGIDKPALTCEVYFFVTQSKYSVYGSPSVEIEYFPDDQAPNEQLAKWLRDFLITEYGVNVTTSEFAD